MHTRRNFSEKSFGSFKDFQICGNKLHERLSLSKEIVADDKS